MTQPLYRLLFICSLFCIGACAPKMGSDLSVNPNQPQEPEKRPTRNIILLIGDGMGLAQVSTRFYYGDGNSNFKRFRCIGLHENQPVRAKITDSAAGATAFSTGFKSYNGAIGVDGDKIPQETIAEIADRKGKSTGMIATSSITHATPASFYAHVENRGMAEAIALELTNSSIDFFAGGGLKYFNKRDDGLNCIDQLQQRDYVVDTTEISIKARSLNKKYGFLLAADGMPTMKDGRGDFLPKATQAALDYLSQDKEGFFLMVEGSQIDWGGHNNNEEYIIEEMEDFDKTIGIALDFAKNDRNTLVIVTADHETGGMSLSAAKVFGQDDYRQIKPTFSTGGHSASLIPVFAFGPGAEEYMGIYSNNEIFDKMIANFDF